MTDEDKDTALSKEEMTNHLKAKRMQENAVLTKRREMAAKWQKEHKENNLLFPTAF